MRHILLSLVTCLVCASCTSQREALVQDDITITTPVEQTKDSNGKPFVRAWPDGGTTMIRITDAADKQFDIYFDSRLDRRIKPSPAPGTDNQEVETASQPEVIIYLNAYTDYLGFVRVIDQEEFKKRYYKESISSPNKALGVTF